MSWPLACCGRAPVTATRRDFQLGVPSATAQRMAAAIRWQSWQANAGLFAQIGGEDRQHAADGDLSRWVYAR